MATKPDSDDDTSAAVAIFQSAVYGNDALLLRRMSHTQNPTISAQIQNPDDQTSDNASSQPSEDIDEAPEVDLDLDEKAVHTDDESDTNGNHDQNQNQNPNPNQNRIRLNWADADDEMKQQFFQMIMKRMQEEHRKKQEDINPDDLYKVGSIVDLSLPYTKYRCDAEILDILPNNEFKVKYIDPADKIEKTTIVSDEFLRATDIELNTETASKYQDEDAINNILLEGVATFSELEYLSVIIHPWVDKYFFKPYLPKGFIRFFRMTDSEMSIDTIIKAQNGYQEYDYDYVSKYIALNILSYAGNKSNMSHKLNCIWCGVDDVLLNKITPRRRLLLGGVPYDKPISVLCDNCGFRFHRDDVIYSCENDHHDVCIKCIWEKVKRYNSVSDTLNEIDFYEIYQLNILPEIRNEITYYACGKLLKFDK